MPPAPRHARQRARPAAAAANRAAAEEQREAQRPRTFREERTAARTQVRARARTRLASRTAGITPEGAALAGAEIGAHAARSARRARLPTGNRRYQGVILAEFVVAVLIVALAPVARGKAPQDQNSLTLPGQTPGPSPYGPDDIKQLAGIAAVYFVLALLSSGKYGRLSAWFGGLVLVAIGLSETTSGGLAGIFGLFQPSSKSAGGSDANPFAGQPGVAQFGQGAELPPGVSDATGIFPVLTPGGQIIPAGVVRPTPAGSPTFIEQVTQAQGGLVNVYQGGPGVVTTDTGTQLA